MELIYHSIGEVFEYQGKTLKVVQSNQCKGCFNELNDVDKCIPLLCGSLRRQDGQNVIFIEIEI